MGVVHSERSAADVPMWCPGLEMVCRVIPAIMDLSLSHGKAGILLKRWDSMSISNWHHALGVTYENGDALTFLSSYVLFLGGKIYF